MKSQHKVAAINVLVYLGACLVIDAMMVAANVVLVEPVGITPVVDCAGGIML